MPELPPESAVHLKAWNFGNASEARNAGYRRIGDEYVRIDLAERVIKKAHEARGQGNLFGMDMAFATSLGISENGLKALMRDAGFRPAEQAPAPSAEAEALTDTVPEALEALAGAANLTPEAEVAETIVSAELEVTAPEAAESEAVVAPAAEAQAIVLTHWRWVGLPKPRPPEQRPQRAKPQHQKLPTTGTPQARPERAPVATKQSAPPSSLALQLAALKGLKL
jgi:ATP-dependent RNA helicase SUPV3L1/SUV3